MEKKKWIKVLGIIATVGGAAMSLLSDWVDDKVVDEKIDERIQERISLLQNEEESE